MTDPAKVYRGTLEHALGLAAYAAYDQSVAYYFYNTVAESGQAGDQIPFPNAVGTAFPDPSNPTYGGTGLFQSLAQADRDVIIEGMTSISQFSAITFSQASNAATTDIGFAGLNYTTSTADAWADAGKLSSRPGNAWYTPRTFIGSSSAATAPDAPYYALIHELGHLLGLHHTFDGSPSSVPVG